MRRSDACNYNEQRDGLATSWYDFLGMALPGSTWVALPNIGDSVVRTVDSLGLNGLILTGGESMGINPQRDESETALISLALKRDIPIIGVCRGLQMLYAHFGGKFVTCAKDEHVAKRHFVFFEKNPLWNMEKQRVNSYHTNAIEVEGLSYCLQPLALDSSGLVEGVFSTKHRLAGIMWHPEREDVFAKSDLSIFRNFFE
ncbi:gamma-glutamyl-gamma-aminobutyrate hydrolase family protein [Maridesulfovibrio zosterae]|uniref:gamma-glutamyl-gamma-aminobutyrate hydrolase family protein n=1 Tax=Maridesulfovibrio zosterae TaxID=82171 RepID=UPI00146B6EF7|nr:gamma-glutamyl-gamma-aminobutyrate hydrolase family protein [Maridesulfovibrio zosterae]